MSITGGKKYNSGKYPDIKDSVEHAKNNQFTMTNLSSRLNYKGRFIMNEPHSVLYQYKTFIMNNLITIPLDERLKYRPEAVSEMNYGTPDLWHIVMIANGISLPVELVGETIKILNPNKTGMLVKLINKNAKNLAKNHLKPHNIHDRTLRSVD